MLSILQKILQNLSARIIQKYSPIVIGITGSIGKTSAKEATYAVLSKKYKNVRRNIKNYNNELGVPLTIIGAEPPGKNLLGWFKIIQKGRALLKKTDPSYPKILILEMAADKPGDIEYLTKIAPCQIGVLTKISPVHIEFFGSVEKITEEKREIVRHLDESGFALLNADDKRVLNSRTQTKAQVITFGYQPNADIKAIELDITSETTDMTGIRFKLNHRGSSVPVFLKHAVGFHQIYATLAAAGVGLALGLNLVEISEGLQNYLPPRGRMNLVKGLGESLIIDDTYNSSPEAAEAALETLEKINIENASRKIAVLGDMLELGAISDDAHYNLGKSCAKKGTDVLICVGHFAYKIQQGALEHGLKQDQVFAVDNSRNAGLKLKNMLKGREIILVKGSQGARMERVVKEIMAEPEQAEELLIRQEKHWQ